MNSDRTSVAQPFRAAAFPPVDAESRRIIREELLTNILVEAGAGSGKTQMLAERMAAGIASGAYQIEHIAAVTFTRKAASELRGRFHLALEQIAGRPDLQVGRAESTPTARGDAKAPAARVQHALSNLERFFAGTIHSFCARLLRERPVESGVSPGFTELDEVQDLELRKRAWRDFVTSTRAAADPDMMALLAAGVQPKDLDSAFATICLNEDVHFPPGDAELPDPKAAWKAAEKFWKELQKHLPADIDSDTNCPIQLAAQKFKGQLDVSTYRLEEPAVVASLLTTWKCKSEIKQFRWADSPAEKRRFRDLINPLHEQFVTDVVTPYLAQWRQYVYRLSVTLLTRAREHAAAERRRLNTLNYGDLLVLTAKVLRENAEVRRALQQKYRHLFVDEFQDTDPVQAEIVFLLAEAPAANSTTNAANTPKRIPNPESRPPTPDWRKIQLRPGALFVVGDPKQSIYRFRRADIDIYNIVRARFSDPAIGRVVPLTMNFRSVAPLCAWANEVFKTRFPAEPTAHAPRFAALDSDDTSTSGGVFTITHACDKGAVLDQDADRIATYIRSEVDAGRRSFSDFLILTRKKRNRIVPYARALEALNIPIEVSGAGAFGESPEVQALTVLLRALSDPQDALALIAVLRGPLFGISDPELFRQKTAVAQGFPPHGEASAARRSLGEGGSPARGSENKTSAVGTVAPPSGSSAPRRSLGEGGPNPEPRTPNTDPAAVPLALEALTQYYRWTRVLPAAAALDRILEHTGYLALASTTAGGVEAGDVLHAVDRVRQVVEEGGSLADAADALEEDVESINEVESLPLEPGRTDVVRIMNLHKAKGLEAKVVFLADPAGGFAPRVDVHIARTDLQPQGWFQVARKNADKPWISTVLGEHADWESHKAAELPYLEAEEDRLLYVAATRARELLVVSRFNGSVREPAWGVLNDFLASAQELPIPNSASAPKVKPLDSSLQAQMDAIAANLSAHSKVQQPSWSITSVTAEAHHIARMTRADDATADDPTKVVTTDTPAHRADAGMAWGTLIHGLLEHAMRHKEATREDLRRLAMWLTVEEPQLRTVMEEALDTVERAARADFWQAAKSHDHSVESPFFISDSGHVTNGVIDLLFDSEAGWQVVDYKTDWSLDDNQYAGQLEAYRAALRTLGCSVASASVVNVRSERT